MAELYIAALLIILVLAAWVDLQQNRIPNLVSLGGITIGIAAQTWEGGLSGLLTGVAGTAVGMGVFLPFYMSGGMGAGDVKLMGTAGAFLGPKYALLATGLSLGAGGILAIIILITKSGLKPLLKRYAATLRCLLRTGKLSHAPPEPGEIAAIKFPYAAAIGIGTLATLWWMGALRGFSEFL